MTIKIGKLKDENDPETDEVRILTASDGKTYRIIMAKKYWESYDILLNTGAWTKQDIIDIQVNDARLADKPVEDYFKDGVSYMHKRLNEATNELLKKDN